MAQAGFDRSMFVLLPPLGGLGLLLAGCAAGGDADRPGFAAAAANQSMASLGIVSRWLDSGRSSMDDAVQDLRQRADGAWQATVTAAGGLSRSVTGRPVATTQACPVIGEVADCAMGARMACFGAGYRDGVPIDVVNYQSCRGLAAVSSAGGVAGACRTKRRLQTAICW